MVTVLMGVLMEVGGGCLAFVDVVGGEGAVLDILWDGYFGWLFAKQRGNDIDEKRKGKCIETEKETDGVARLPYTRIETKIMWVAG